MFVTKKNIEDLLYSSQKDIDYDAMHIVSYARMGNEFFVKFAGGIGNLAEDSSNIHAVETAILTFGYPNDIEEEEYLVYEKVLNVWHENITPLRVIGTTNEDIILILEDENKYVPVPRK